jgi:RHS repeat-associated protein
MSRHRVQFDSSIPTGIFRHRLAISLAIAVLALASRTYGQQPDYEQQGLTFYGSYEGGNVDRVNVKNGNVMLRIPLVSFPQRGSLKLSYSLSLNNSGFYYSKTCDSSGWCTGTWSRQFPKPSVSTIGPSVGMDQGLSLYASQQSINVGGIQGTTYYYYLYTLTDFTGAQHPLGFDNNNLSHLYATDGSGYLAVASGGNAYEYSQQGNVSFNVYSSGGMKYAFPDKGGSGSATSITDPDGNAITIGSTSTTDSVGRSIPAVGSMTTSTTGCPALNLAYQPLIGSATWSVPGPNGSTQNFLLCYTSVTYRTNLSCSGTPTFCNQAVGSQNVIQSVVLPNGTYWAFAFDAANPSDNTSKAYADLLKVWLPTGGTISYQYTNWALPNYNRNLAQRTLAVGDGTQNTWNYSRNSSTGLITSSDPLANDTVYTFSSLFNGTCAAGSLNGFETNRNIYAGSQTTGQLIRTITTTYQETVNPQSQGVNTCSTTLPATIKTTLVDSGQSTTTTYAYSDGGFVNTEPWCYPTGPTTDTCQTSSRVPATQTPFGRVTSTSITDYSGSTMKTVNTQYQQQVSSSYKAANFLDLVASATILNGSGAQVGKTSYGYDENNGSPQGVYGHQTSVSKWLNTNSGIVPCNGTTAGSNVTTCSVFNAQGMISQTTDPNGNTTKYTYDSTGAFLGQIQYPDTTYGGSTVHHNVGLSFDANTGLQLSSTDQNGNVTSRQYDNMRRVTQISYPDGGLTTYCYTDEGGTCSKAGAPYEVVVTKAISSSPTLNETSTIVVDGFGRLTQTQLNSDSPSTSYTLTTYDAVGRKSQVYNPTRCSPISTNCGESTWGYSTYKYDSLNRVTSLVEPDGSTVSTSYTGNCTTVTDEAGKLRKSCVDGLGRMTGVWEDPGSSPHLKYETDYAYDSLNNLTSVTQKGGAVSSSWRTRTFTYDSLSQLLCAANPEIQAVACPSSATGTFPTGAITYSYDTDGNILTKASPSPNQSSRGTANVTTTYTYDALNRLTGKSYSDSYNGNMTPGVTYGYDGANISTCPTAIGFQGGSGTNSVGRRTAMCFGGGSKSWTFDPMGRIKSENDRFIWLVPPYSADVTTINGVSTLSENTTYSYYLNGDLANTFYPGPKGPPDYEFYTDENAAGQVTLAGDVYYNVFTSATYTPTGQLATASVGASSTYNGSKMSNTYNNRLQPVLVSASTYSGASILNLTYNFNLGNGTSGSDNGNVIQIANGKDSNRTQNFLYDSLNRIQQAYSNGPNWGETYSPTATSPGVAPSTSGIDAWGNLTNRSGVTGKSTYEPLSCSANTQNQLNTCYGYDAAGNLTKNGNASYTYDAENRLIATAGISYVYDGDGQRVEKCTQGTAPGTCASNATGTFYWLHAGGGTLAESDLGGNWTAAYGLIRGQVASRVDLPANVVHYYYHDNLGTSNIVTDAVGNILKESDYYPYGGEISIINNDSNRYKFTGKERDSESSLDYFGARFDASSVGRFMSPDPGNINIKHLLNPQKWNKYAYTLNNPLRFFDPDGNQEMEIQFRSFIQQQSVGDPLGRRFAGDGRSFTVGQDVSSRTTITVRIETDASKRPGNPIISVTQPGKAGPSIQLDANGNAVKTDQAKSGLPTVTGFRDENGNAVLQFVQDTKNPLEPQSLTPPIRADLGVTVGQNGSWVDASGMLSGTPSFELNVQDSNGNTTNIPLQSEPSGAAFGLGLFLPLGIENFTPLPPPPPPAPATPASGCAFANKAFCFI